MDYEKKYKEALERAKKFYNELAACRTKQKVAAIFPELAESEDERIRKALVIMIKVPRKEIFEAQGITKEQALAYLEKLKELIDPFDTKLFQDGVKEGRRLEREDIEKEPIPIPDKFSGLKSLMLQYLQSAANRKDDIEIENDTDLWGRKILDYVWKYSEKSERAEAKYQRNRTELYCFLGADGIYLYSTGGEARRLERGR